MNNRETPGRHQTLAIRKARAKSASVIARQINPVGVSLRPPAGNEAFLVAMTEAAGLRMSGSHQPAETMKAPDHRGLYCLPVTVAYFSELLIELNLVFSELPMPLTTAIIASEMPAAIRPYSMAVAPDSSFTKRAIRFFISQTPCTRGWSN